MISGGPLKIAVIGHIRNPIAEPFMGGMEAHCAALCTGLVKQGHEPTLFAAPGSDVNCRHVAICDQPYEAILPWATYRGTEALDSYQAIAFDFAWRHILAADFDVLHNNSLHPQLVHKAKEAGVAMLTSQHVPPFGTMHDAVKSAAGCAHVRFSVTSQAQIPLWFEEAPSNLTVIHNGIDENFWHPMPSHGRIVWTGRITPNKGTALVVQSARQAGVRLDIAGTVEDEEYFAGTVEPYLSKDIRYLGHLDGEKLRALVAGATAVCVTPMWEEPFGLVAAEALSCDVPVIAFDRGAMAEVIGDCGVLVPAGDADALSAAMAKPPALTPGKARARALAMFSNSRMIEGYVREYRLAIAGARELLGLAA